jgi:anti-sigma-K factor RskA
MHVDDFASFPAQDLEALATNLRAEVEVDPRWLVPRAWARIIVSLVFNQAFRRTRIASTELDGRLAQWRSRPAAHWDYWAGRAPFQELNEIIDPTPAQSPHTTVDALQAKLEDWASTVPRDGRSF